MYSKYAVNTGSNWHSGCDEFEFVVNGIRLATTQSKLTSACYPPNDFCYKKAHNSKSLIGKECLQSCKGCKQSEHFEINRELQTVEDEIAAATTIQTNGQTHCYQNPYYRQSNFEIQSHRQPWQSVKNLNTKANVIQDPYKKFSNNNYDFNIYENPCNLKPLLLPICEPRQNRQDQHEPLYVKSQRNFNPAYDQHYQHYYSYFYKCNPTDYTKLSRIGPRPAFYSLAMPSLNKSHCDPFTSLNPVGNSVNEEFCNNSRCRTRQKVVKEKVANNNNSNSVQQSSNWYDHITNTPALKGAGDYQETYSKIYENKTMYYDREFKASNLQMDIQNNKNKLRVHCESNAFDKINISKEISVRMPAGDDERAKIGDESTLAYNNGNSIYCTTQSSVIKSRIIKKSALSPIRTRRVLLYNSQSPRLRRMSSTHMRYQRPRNKLKAEDGINHKHLPHNHNNNNSKVLKGRIRILKSMSPTKDLVNARENIDDNGNVNYAANKISDGTDSDIDDIDNVSEGGGSNGSYISSDSEDGYRTFAYKLTHSIDHVPNIKTFLACHQFEDCLTNPPNVLVASLFPNVPPYLSFSTNSRKGPNVPPDLYRVLKWRVSNVMPRVVRCILANSGMRLLKKTNDWMGVWGKHMKSPCFKSIRAYQKINHLPGSFRIGRKDSCWKNLSKLMAKHGKRDFGFMPKTYIIPNDLRQLRKSWPKYAQKKVKWIIKPPASARGTGIRVVDRWAQIPKRRPLIVQKYIERPLLINGSKFDLRLYVLVTSINPLRVYMYHNGLARFASVKYSDKSDTLNDRCMHLTNYSINKLSSNYAKNEDVNACHGHKWTIKSLWNYLSTRGVRIECLWEALRNLVLRTILAGENSINNMIKANVESKYSCFELFGFDVLLDADLIPWLLEVNISPSLHSELPLDSHVKAPLVQSVLNTALYNVPPKLSIDRQLEIAEEMSLPAGPICYDKRMYVNYLSRIEKVKQTNFTRKSMEDREEYLNSILEHLTPDDVRCLIITEDELARCKPLERVFPTPHTHKYLKFTESPRYYNRLLDAWETRYANSRGDGIALLQRFCEEKYHLQVPTVPAKKDSSDEVEDDDTPNSRRYSDT